MHQTCVSSVFIYIINLVSFSFLVFMYLEQYYVGPPPGGVACIANCVYY